MDKAIYVFNKFAKAKSKIELSEVAHDTFENMNGVMHPGNNAYEGKTVSHKLVDSSKNPFIHYEDNKKSRKLFNGGKYLGTEYKNEKGEWVKDKPNVDKL